LENVVKFALRACAGEIIRPQSLPIRIMNDLLRDAPVTKSEQATDATRRDHVEGLIGELARSLPADWMTLTHEEASGLCVRALNRVYLPNMYERHGYNLTAASKAAGLDPKTFRKYWKEAGLPPLSEWKKKTDG
jgi:hypothetical protein